MAKIAENSQKYRDRENFSKIFTGMGFLAKWPKMEKRSCMGEALFSVLRFGSTCGKMVTFWGQNAQK